MAAKLRTTCPERATLEQAVVSLWQSYLSAGKIAEKLGISRNTVVGIVNRLGLLGKGGSLADNYRLQRRALERKQDAQRDEARRDRLLARLDAAIDRPLKQPLDRATLREITRPATAVTLENLADDGCKMPFDTPEGWLYCGAPRAARKPYCERCLPGLYTTQRETRETLATIEAETARIVYRRLLD